MVPDRSKKKAVTAFDQTLLIRFAPPTVVLTGLPARMWKNNGVGTVIKKSLSVDL